MNAESQGHRRDEEGQGRKIALDLMDIYLRMLRKGTRRGVVCWYWW